LLYLFRNHRHRGKFLVALVAAVHVTGCLGLLVVRNGTDISPGLADRQRWVLSSVPQWTTVWFLWALCSLSLTAFFPLWGMALKERFGIRGAIVLAATIFLAVPFDLVGEWHYIAKATDPSLTLTEFGSVIWRYNLFSAAIANGLYCLLGLCFSIMSWRACFL